MLPAIIIILSFSITLSWLWAGGIDYMHKHHKDYKGEDFLNWKNDKDHDKKI